LKKAQTCRCWRSIERANGMGAGVELMQGSLSARLHGDREHGYRRAVAQFIVKGSAPTSDADYVTSLN
jgi:hypothetical protein